MQCIYLIRRLSHQNDELLSSSSQGYNKLLFGAVTEVPLQDGTHSFTVNLDRRRCFDKDDTRKPEDGVDFVQIAVEEGFGDFATIHSVTLCGEIIT